MRNRREFMAAAGATGAAAMVARFELPAGAQTGETWDVVAVAPSGRRIVGTLRLEEAQ